jgi:hypothetical protein
MQGEKFFNALEPFVWAVPNIIGNSEPLREKYRNPQQALSLWHDPFLWKNSLRKAEGSVWFGHKKMHSCIFLHLKPGTHPVQQNEMTRCLVELSERFNADFGYVHLTTDREMVDPTLPHELNYAVDTGLTTHDLSKGIPKLCWAMVFGPRYASVGARFEAAQTQGVLTRRTANGQHTLVQLTPDLTELSADYEAFQKKRDEVKRIVGADFLRALDGGMAQWRPNFPF